MNARTFIAQTEFNCISDLLKLKTMLLNVAILGSFLGINRGNFAQIKIVISPIIPKNKYQQSKKQVKNIT